MASSFREGNESFCGCMQDAKQAMNMIAMNDLMN